MHSHHNYQKKQSSFEAVNSSSSTQEIPCIL